MLEQLLRKAEPTILGLTLRSPWLFRTIVRPLLYRMHDDPEDIHAHALEALNRNEDVIREHARLFNFPNIRRTIKGKEVKPFGTAAGFDKNCEALLPLGHIFGFQVPGTIVIKPRDGNPRPRVAVDHKNENLYNAQGFPSKGLHQSVEALRTYRATGTGIIYASICGMPNESKPLESALAETRELCEQLSPYVDGYIWNCYSPNSESLRKLRTPESFKAHAQVIREYAGERLVLTKMGPIQNRTEWLAQLSAFIDGGGDGASMINTHMVPKEQVPSEQWGYQSAGKSGRFLRELRKQALEYARHQFPNAILFGTGGVFDKDDIKHTLEYADAIKGYTPYTFYGLGLLREQLKFANDILR